MRSTSLAIAAAAVGAQALSLNDVCSTTYAKAALPASGTFEGITIDPSSLSAQVTYNTTTDSVYYPDTSISYCNVTFAYSHDGRDDKVHVQYWLPAPSQFQNRYLTTGGFGYAINVEATWLPSGIVYGAVSGATDGGFGSFDTNFDAVFPLENGTANYEALHMMGYQGLHEQTLIGKEYTKNFFNVSDSQKVYTYYQGCSEGGREGWSQIQRYADQWDGAVVGAPAMRFAFQQVNHLVGNVIERDLGYYPPYCELEAIVNLTISACDEYDGKADGVIGRTDLCQLNFDLDSLVGQPYSCAASSGSTQVLKRRQIMDEAASPAQNGTITKKGVEVAKKYYDGLHDSDGKRVYLSYQIGTAFDDAETEYDFTTDTWGLSISSFGAEFVQRLLNLVDSDDFYTLDNITVDTLKEWMHTGWQQYEDTLHTTWPELTPFQKAGGKVIHYHGESDNSVPAAASVHYWESVRKIMYPNMSYTEGAAALNEWYRLYLVPGASHCNPNTLQPNGPFPKTQLTSLIDWVEKDVTPVTLPATILSGSNEGTEQDLCTWPLRPLWKDNGTTLDCVYDQKSIDTWHYDFDAFKMPVY